MAAKGTRGFLAQALMRGLPSRQAQVRGFPLRVANARFRTSLAFAFAYAEGIRYSKGERNAMDVFGEQMRGEGNGFGSTERLRNAWACLFR